MKSPHQRLTVSSSESLDHQRSRVGSAARPDTGAGIHSLRALRTSLSLVLFLTASSLASGAGDGIFHWSFDQDEAGSVKDAIQGSQDKTFGPIAYVEGVRGSAIKLDGFRSYIQKEKFPHADFSGGFMLDAWVALPAYPWSWTPIIDCSQNELQGFFFGIGPDGEFALDIGIGNNFHQVRTKPVVPLQTWTHLAASFEPGKGVRLYVNGNLVEKTSIEGNFLVPNPHGSVTLGRTLRARDWRERQLRTENTHFYLDGLLDEVRMTLGVMTEQSLQVAANKARDLPAPALSKRDRLPAGPKGDGSFGAFYTRLDYYDEWDALWRVEEKPDIFVRFDDSPVQFIFWRGTSFVPCWVNEKGIWYTNEWLETWGADVRSCAEPIMDRHCRFSHVRLIENTPARVVIHWRYALVDTFYTFAAVTDDGRGEWADEYYIIYPDQVGVRKINLHYSIPERKHDWVEQIVVMPPGKHPDEAVERDAITLVNMKGDAKVYTWTDDIKIGMTEPKGANISHVNMKSTYQPFIIIPDDPVDTVEGKWDSPFFRTYAAGQAMNGYRPDPVPSVFGWWDHWPVAQIPGDGRWVTTPDRPSHFTLTTFVQWKDHKKTERTRTRVMLQGMIDAGPKELVPLAHSWLHAPELETGSGYRSHGYDTAERAYVLEQTDGGKRCEIEIAAAKDRPLINPAIIIRNWGSAPAQLKLNGKPVASGTDFRQGTVQTMDGHDLIIWLKLESETPVSMTLAR